MHLQAWLGLQAVLHGMQQAEIDDKNRVVFVTRVRGATDQPQLLQAACSGSVMRTAEASQISLSAVFRPGLGCVQVLLRLQAMLDGVQQNFELVFIARMVPRAPQKPLQSQDQSWAVCRCC